MREGFAALGVTQRSRGAVVPPSRSRGWLGDGCQRVSNGTAYECNCVCSAPALRSHRGSRLPQPSLVELAEGRQRGEHGGSSRLDTSHVKMRLWGGMYLLWTCGSSITATSSGRCQRCWARFGGVITIIIGRGGDDAAQRMDPLGLMYVYGSLGEPRLELLSLCHRYRAHRAPRGGSSRGFRLPLACCSLGTPRTIPTSRRQNATLVGLEPTTFE